MRNLFLIFLCVGLLGACQTDTAEQSETQTPASEQEEAFNPMENGQIITVNNEEGIQLKIANSAVRQGERICLDVKASSFNDVMSMQYTIVWDPALLEFAALGKFQLKHLSTNNFGAHLAPQGKLTFSWFDQELQGISVPENTPIYELCFVATGDAGARAEISFSETPVPFEISNKAGQIIRFDHRPGSVKIQ